MHLFCKFCLIIITDNIKQASLRNVNLKLGLENNCHIMSALASDFVSVAQYWENANSLILSLHFNRFLHNFSCHLRMFYNKTEMARVTYFQFLKKVCEKKKNYLETLAKVGISHVLQFGM